MSEKLEERWPKRWHCIEARDNEFAEQSGPGKPIMAVRNGVNIGTVDLCPKCFETFDHHAAKPEQPPFEHCQRVRTKDGRVLDVSRCEKRVVHGTLRWVVDDLNGARAFADDCELFDGVNPVSQHRRAEPVPQWCKAMDLLMQLEAACRNTLESHPETKCCSVTRKRCDEARDFLARHAPRPHPLQGVHDDGSLLDDLAAAACQVFGRDYSKSNHPVYHSLAKNAMAAIIARHAPKEVPQQVAILESMLANEERSCMEVLKERDTAIGFCDLFAATILGEDINWSCHETKWQEALDMLSNGKTIEISGIMLRRSGDYAIVEAEVDGKWREVIREFIDAPSSHIVEPAGILQSKESELHAVPDGVEAEPQPAPRYACSKLAAVGDRVKEVGADFGQYLRVSKIHDDGSIDVETLDGKSCAIAIASSLEFVPEVTPVEAPHAATTPPAKPAASEVKRYKVPDDYVGVVRHKGYGHVEVVTAAAHDAAIAALMERIEEEERRGDLHADLNKRIAEAIGNPFQGDGSSWHDLPEKVSAIVEQLAVAKLLLGQCDNRMFLVGRFEIRRRDGGWILVLPGNGTLVDGPGKFKEFADPVQAALRAKELADVGKVGV